VRVEVQQSAGTSLSDSSALTKAVEDHYRFPSRLLNFRLTGDLSSESEFFQFGRSICYGRSDKTAGHSNTRSTDLEFSTSFDGDSLVLPFNPTEVIDNLRLERYPSGQFGQFERTLKSLYYRLRPFTNRTLRAYVQRVRANKWQNRPFPNWPVDTTVEDLCETLLLLFMQKKGVDRIPFIWFWPRGARASVSMTHDVETAAGRDFCNTLLEINESYAIKASFQIVPEQRYQVPTAFLDKLRAHGCEVCVQDLNHDGRLFDQQDEFRRRASLINKYAREYGATGFRSAVLYRKPEWYEHLDFSYDMSIPNVAHLDPQRGGCCTVMPYFIGDMVELPLTTVQDYSLFHILKETSISLWRTQFETLLSKNGMATFIVHPDYVTGSETLALYKDLLAMLNEFRSQTNLWFALPGEISNWWRARGQMSIVGSGNAWRITGKDADQAVLAFAAVVDGKLVYELPE